MKCTTPGCNCDSENSPLVLHSGCHAEAPTWAVFQKDTLTIKCSVCNKHIVSFRVELVDGFPAPIMAKERVH